MYNIIIFTVKYTLIRVFTRVTNILLVILLIVKLTIKYINKLFCYKSSGKIPLFLG